MPSELACALWGCVAHGNDHLLLIDWQDGSRRETSYFPAEDDRRFCGMLDYHLAEGNDPKVGLVPRRDKHVDGLAESCVVWASVENTVARRSLAAFRPLPTILMRQGQKRVAVWWLNKPLPVVADPSQDWLTRANKRLAFALKANSRHAQPEWLCPVGVLEHADAVCYPPDQVVGRLKDAPVRLRSVPRPILGAA